MLLTGTWVCKLWQTAPTGPSCLAKVTGTGIRFVPTPPHLVAKISSRAWWQVNLHSVQKNKPTPRACDSGFPVNSREAKTHKSNQLITVCTEEHKLNLNRWSDINCTEHKDVSGSLFHFLINTSRCKIFLRTSFKQIIDLKVIFKKAMEQHRQTEWIYK